MANAHSATAGMRYGLNQISLLLHIRKTALLVNAVLRDRRVHWLRKATFLGVLGALAAMVISPELAADAFSLLVPVLGFFGIPIEVGTEVSLDWVVFAVAAFNLLHIFPADIVGEHYDRLFRGRHR